MCSDTEDSQHSLLHMPKVKKLLNKTKKIQKPVSLRRTGNDREVCERSLMGTRCVQCMVRHENDTWNACRCGMLVLIYGCRCVNDAARLCDSDAKKDLTFQEKDRVLRDHDKDSSFMNKDWTESSVTMTRTRPSRTRTRLSRK